MARLDKKELKLIIKECLIEILAEGLAPSTSARKGDSKRRMNEAFNRKSKQNRPVQKRKSYLDNIRVGGQQTNPRQERMQESMSQITSDPVMQDILRDTASTTLVEQGSSSATGPATASARPADKAAAIVDQSDPTELFAESAQNWATLAFS